MRKVPVFAHRGKSPKIHGDAVVSSLATIIGDVEISEGASIFPGAVLRGDVAKITIRKHSNIQDNVVLHGGDVYEGDTLKRHIPIKIGEYVTVAHSAIVHETVDVEYRNCSATWKAVKRRIREDEDEFIAQIKKALTEKDITGPRSKEYDTR